MASPSLPPVGSAEPTGRAHQRRPETSIRKIHQRSSSWSPWVPRSFRRQIFDPKDDKSHHADHDTDHEPDRVLINKGSGGSLKLPWRRKSHPKSVTIEEPGNVMRGVTDSDNGTVIRFPKLDGPDNAPGQQDRNQDTQKNEARNLTMRKKDQNTYGNYLDVPTEDRPARKTTNKRRARTVSRDDYLTARGANPRTGLVSPSLSSSSRPSGEQPRLHVKAKPQSPHKWRLKGDQWISMGTNDKTPSSSPSVGTARPQGKTAPDHAQGYINLLSDSGVPLSRLEDRFVVNMPSAKEPSPPTMTTEQISDFQKAVERLRRRGPKPNPSNARATIHEEPNKQSTKGFPRFMKRISQRNRPDKQIIQRHKGQQGGPRNEDRVHFANLPEKPKHQGVRAQQGKGRPLISTQTNIPTQPFLDGQGEGGMYQIPFFQPMAALLSRSLPWTNGRASLEEEDAHQNSATNIPDLQQEQIGGRLPLEDNLLERRTKINMQRLPLDGPMRIPVLKKSEKGGPYRTITPITPAPTPAMPQSQSRKVGEEPGTVNHPNVRKGQDCISPSSFHSPPESLVTGPTGARSVVDLRGTAGDRVDVDPVKHFPDGESQKIANNRVGFARLPVIQSLRSRFYGGIHSPYRPLIPGSARSHEMAGLQDGRQISHNRRCFECPPASIPPYGQPMPDYRRIGPQPPPGVGMAIRPRGFTSGLFTSTPSPGPQTFAPLWFLIRQIFFTAFLLCLKSTEYLCDICRIYLSFESVDEDVSTEQDREGYRPFHPELDRDVGHLRCSDRLWICLSIVFCAGALFLVARGIEWITDAWLWAVWVMRMGT